MKDNNNNKEELVHELARTLAQFKKLSSQSKSAQAIRPSEFTLLYTMIQNDPASKGMKVSDLSTQLQITPAGVTHTINSLEEGGYLERLADLADRRVVLVRATDLGKETIQAMRAKHFEFLKGLTSFLGEGDSKELIRILTAALTYFKEKRGL